MVGLLVHFVIGNSRFLVPLKVEQRVGKRAVKDDLQGGVDVRRVGHRLQRRRRRFAALGPLLCD